MRSKNAQRHSARRTALALRIAEAEAVINKEPFTAAGGVGQSGSRTIAKNWLYVDIKWLVKIKTDSKGDVHYEAWEQPHGKEEPPRHVLNKPKILTVEIKWLREEKVYNGATRHVLSAADYERLVEACK